MARTRVAWGINLLILVALALVGFALFSTAYGSGNPAFQGHSSDEIQFAYQDVLSTCTASASTDCVVTCPASTFLVAGFCATATPKPYWADFGRVDPNGVSYHCDESSHLPGVALVAYATCMQGANS